MREGQIDGAPLAAHERPMTADWPAVAGIDASVYVIPTDAPEADGTLAWNETTMVLVTAQAGDHEGIGWSYAAAAAAISAVDIAHWAPNLHAHVGAATVNLRHVEYFRDHQRIEQLLFDGTLDPLDGVLSPEPGRPGLGLELRTSDAEKYRRL